MDKHAHDIFSNARFGHQRAGLTDEDFEIILGERTNRERRIMWAVEASSMIPTSDQEIMLELTLMGGAK